MSMQALMAASQSLARMQTMQSARTQMQGTANVLRTESKLDRKDGTDNSIADSKESKAGDLEKKSSNLMCEIADVNETLKPDKDAKAEEAKKEEAAKNPAKTDTISLSDAATKQLSKQPGAKPAVLEAVTYQANGSTKSSEPVKTAPKFEVTA